MKNSILILVLALSIPVWAKKKPAAVKLENFSVGTARLVSGVEEYCGDDEIDFYYTEDNQVVNLGPFHTFSTQPKFLKLPGDAPGDENCTYEADYTKQVDSDVTTLKYSEVRSCDKVEKHQLTKTAVIHKKEVTLTVVQSGEDAQAYECKWRLK